MAEEVAAPRGRRRATPEPAFLGKIVSYTVQVLFSGAIMGVAATIFSLFIWTTLPLLVGWSPSVVLTGSMEPAIQPGDIVVTSPAGEHPFKAGQVVRFQDPARPQRFLMHRIHEVNNDGTLTTGGDNNQSKDSTPVPVDHVTGVARLRVPLIGLPLIWLRDDRFLELGLTMATVVLTPFLFAGTDGKTDGGQGRVSPSNLPPPGGRHGAGSQPGREPGRQRGRRSRRRTAEGIPVA